MNVARLVLDCVDRCGEYTAVYFEGQSFTNVQRLRRAEQLATVFRDFGVRPGDRVVVMMPNSPDVTAAFHAIWRIGAVIVPLPPQLLAAEARYIIGSSGLDSSLRALDSSTDSRGDRWTQCPAAVHRPSAGRRRHRAENIGRRAGKNMPRLSRRRARSSALHIGHHG